MAEADTPVVVYAGEEEGTQEYEDVCRHVREACELHGFFILQYDIINKSFYEQMLTAMKELFDLPTETKQRYQNPLPYRSYNCNSPLVPLLESFGMDGTQSSDTADKFAAVFWPEGNPEFSAAISNMASKMLEINQLMSRMIFRSFHVDKYFTQHVASCTGSFRLMKYNIPQRNTDSALGLISHTDKNFITVLSQNDVQGLEILFPDGVWRQLVLPEGSFVIFAGDMLKAWSNGRVRAAEHRVTMSGDHVRYTWAMFSVPMEGTKIEAPPELVDADHPLLYRPFNYSEFMSFFSARAPNIENALEVYAGV